MTKSSIMDFYNLFLCSGVQPLMLKWRPDLMSTGNSVLETEVCGNFFNERDGLLFIVNNFYFQNNRDWVIKNETGSEIGY